MLKKLPSWPAFTKRCILFGSTKEYSFEAVGALLIINWSDINLADGKFPIGVNFVQCEVEFKCFSLLTNIVECNLSSINDLLNEFCDLFPFISINSTFKILKNSLCVIL